MINLMHFTPQTEQQYVFLSHAFAFLFNFTFVKFVCWHYSICCICIPILAITHCGGRGVHFNNYNKNKKNCSLYILIACTCQSCRNLWVF